MKKLLSFCLMLCLALSLGVGISVTAYTVNAAEDDEFIVYIYDEQEWDLSVYCYSGGGDFGSGWPGTAPDRAPELGDDWYSFTLPQNPNGAAVNLIIFDSAHDSNRQDVVFKNGAYYNTYGTASFTSKEAAMTDAASKRPKLVDKIYIYNFDKDKNTERWDTVYATCYDNRTGDQLGEGVTLSKAASVGANWYEYSLPKEAHEASDADYKFRARVVLRNGENGREQLMIVAPVAAKQYYNTYREYGFATKTTAASSEMNCVYSDPKTGTTTIYFYNSQRWKTVYAYAYWTYEAANNINVEDFGGWPGKAMREYSGRENWYYIDVPQDVAKQPVNVVFSGPKGRAEKDSYISSATNVYFDYKGAAYSSFEAVEKVTPMIDPLPEADDYLMDFSEYDTTPKTDRVIDYKEASFTAPIVLCVVAGVLLASVGTAFIIVTVRRKKR